MKLTDRNWKSFKITDLFEISGTKTTSLRTLKTKNETQKAYPYITTKSNFMGVDGFFNYYTEEGNVIVIDSATDGNIHYQENNFSASDHVEKLIPKFKMNKYIGFFIVSSLRYGLNKKFHYGYKLAQKRIERQIIMLPIDNEGNPDYNFMEDYIKYTYKLCEQDFSRNIVDKKLEKLNYIEIDNLNEKKWNNFKLNEIFEKIQRGKRLTKAKFIDGETPYISSSSLNNGIDAFIGNTENVRKFDNCLTLANSGSVGSTFYHPYTFIASDHVTHLKNEKFNKYTYLFIAPLIERLKEKYNYNREMNDIRLDRELLFLPITENGEPDYNYMEQFMINREIILLNKYKKYIENNRSFE